MSVSPIFCSIGHTGKQLHSFRVVVELRVEAQILLHEIIGCHVPLSILIHHTGILRENNTNIITAAADQKTKARCPLTLSRHSSLIHLLPWHSCLPPNIHLTRLRPINRATSHLCYQTPKCHKKQLLSADRGTRSQRRKWSLQLKSPDWQLMRDTYWYFPIRATKWNIHTINCCPTNTHRCLDFLEHASLFKLLWKRRDEHRVAIKNAASLRNKDLMTDNDNIYGCSFSLELTAV